MWWLGAEGSRGLLEGGRTALPHDDICVKLPEEERKN